MTALPSDIARFTSDGVEIERASLSIKDAYPNAADVGSDDLEMFFDDAADGYVLLQERYALLSLAGRPHEAVEVAGSFGLGTAVPLFPSIPRFEIVDQSRSLSAQAVVRSLAYDMGSDKYSVELMGIGKIGTPVTVDTTTKFLASSSAPTVDSTFMESNT